MSVCQCVCMIYTVFMIIYAYSTMKQPSFVTVCGMLIKKLFVLLVCLKKGKVGFNTQEDTLSVHILFTITLVGVCHVSTLPVFESEERQISLPSL